MARTTDKHAAKIPGNGGHLKEGPDLEESSPHRIFMMHRKICRTRESTRTVWEGQVTGMKTGLMITKNKREAGGEAEVLPLLR